VVSIRRRCWRTNLLTFESVHEYIIRKMPRIRSSRRRDLRERREAGEINPRAPFVGYHAIRPTHVDSYGLRYEIPVNPPLNQSIKVSMYFPSDDQTARRCDGCARSHQKSRRKCSANPGVSIFWDLSLF
jgi:hypothetical protein